LQSNEALHNAIQESSLLDFCSQVKQEKYPVVLNNVRIWICQFASTYCCESAFSMIKINLVSLFSRWTFNTHYWVNYPQKYPQVPGGFPVSPAGATVFVELCNAITN